VRPLFAFQLRQHFPDGKVTAGNYGQRVLKHLRTITFTDATEVAAHYDLVSGHYLVIPCTYTPGVEMKFLLRIFAETDSHSWYARM